jgi:PKD repeat protein
MDAPETSVFPRIRALCMITVLAVIAAVLLAVQPAVADTAPVDPTEATTVSSDALPTVQINGIVWTQKVIGNTVYAGGNFSSAQPAGAAAGVNTVSRSNLLAYDVTTGNLITSFAPVFNGQIKALAASPDGSTLYVGGEFTTVNGLNRYRIAAFNTATGQLITSFAPALNTTVNALAATNSAVYVGGPFSTANNTTRLGAAAFNSANGALLPWAPTEAGGSIQAMVISPDASKLVIGGSFTTVNGSSNPGYGLAAVDSASGALLPWNINGLIRNGGTEAAILTLSSDSTYVYGSGYVFGSGGNLEGTFKATWDGGNLVWVEDCHGDTYSNYVADNGVVYVAGHPHYCGNIGGFPQTSPTWTFHRALAFSPQVTGTITTDPYGYYNFAGTPRPSLLNWFPDFNTGTVSGATQGPWSVAGNSQYVVYGGEFTTVNGARQQGLVRFAVKSIAPNRDGPRLGAANFVPNVVSVMPGTVRVSWQSNWDRDNESLTYSVIRDGVNASPIYTTTQSSTFWNRPILTYQDVSLTPGTTHTYRLKATDPFGNVAWGNPVSVTVASGTVGAYQQDILNSAPTSYWPLGENSGSTGYDWATGYDQNLGTGTSRGASGPLSDSSTATTFDGSSAGFASTSAAQDGPQVFSLEAWVKTTSHKGGKIIGFGDAQTGNSSSYDRQVYMDNAGHIWFGVYPGSVQTLSTAKTYNDGQWHQIVASLGSGGMTLYIDGKRAGQRSDVTSAQVYSGYWRIGGDNLSSWSGQPSSNYFAGSIADVAVYPNVLTGAQVVDHYVASGRTSPIPPAPTDAYGAAVYGASPDLYWRLDETSGTTAADSGALGNTGSYYGTYTQGVGGALAGASGTAASFNGGVVSSNTAVTNPTTYTIESWFKTTTTQGGKIIGFGDQQNGLSSNYDRHVYMQDNGQLVFGTYTGQTNTVTSAKSYNDGLWHYVAAAQSSAGMVLYVDGVAVGTNPQTSAQNYTGYWRIGGDNTWGSSSPYFAGTIDEAAVYSQALTAQVIANHYSLGTTGVPANIPPSAAFTSMPTQLSVAFDGSASADPDGTVASYAWDFGDGQTGAGVTATHVYAAAGTYTVTLTVTDNDGATGTVSHDVTVTAPPANVPPTAAFTPTVTNLGVAVDGSASSDSDGTVASYSWDFGDSSAAGSGETATHVYSTAGTYTVTLTVTDNDGATGTVSHDITVAAPSVLARDSFNRSVTSGWGVADVGGSWTTTGSASKYAVGAGSGTMSLVAGATQNASLSSVSSNDTEIQVTASVPQAITGTGVYISAVARKIGTDSYLARVRIMSDGSATIQTMRGGTSLAAVAVSGLTYSSGDQLQLRVQAFGTSPTTIRAKVWKVGTSEPGGWQVSSTDSTASLQAAGSLGLTGYLGSSATSAVSLAFSSLWAGSTTAGGPPANVPPTAAFTSSVSGLTVSVDGTGSSDPDGTVASYAWDFGDGGSGTGAKASHAYAAAGTYTAVLTVTDNSGATGTVSHSVTVTTPPANVPFAKDAFARTVTGGLGTADTGGVWAVAGGAANFSVGNGAARFSSAKAGATITGYLNSVSSSSSDVLVTAAPQQPVTGTGVYVSVLARTVGADDYRARVRIFDTGQVNIQVMHGATSLQAVAVAGLSYASGDQLQIRVEAVGTSPTTIRAKVWKVGTTEPTAWQVSVTDSTASMQQAGGVGLSTYLGGSVTTVPFVVAFTNLVAIDPNA